jgi:hypothetical protein
VYETCRRFPGHTIKVRSYILDSEGLFLAVQILRVLRQCKTMTVLPDLWTILPGIDNLRVGVRVDGPPSQHEFVAALKKSFGVDEKLFLSRLPPPTPAATSDQAVVVIVVGMRQLPKLE